MRRAVIERPSVMAAAVCARLGPLTVAGVTAILFAVVLTTSLDVDLTGMLGGVSETSDTTRQPSSMITDDAPDPGRRVPLRDVVVLLVLAAVAMLLIALPAWRNDDTMEDR